MNGQTQQNMPNKLKGYANKLCSMKVKDDFSFSMTVSADDEGNKSNCFYKKISSSTEFNLVKGLAIVAAVGIVIGLICSTCSAMKKN